ncbi:hypothetical protein KY311_02820 [Candidatus Woesearchaeota archaeon]|nr:hypothetical protein [Candidatus Woesearchaeota archaeon]MBW3016732.1 hypothetical protein [Candidatus Woesearchaeota archaeon]
MEVIVIEDKEILRQAMKFGTYLTKEEMVETFYENWIVLNSIVKRFSGQFRPIKFKGETFYCVNPLTEEIMDVELNLLYQSENEDDETRAFTNLRDVVRKANEQIKKGKKLSQQFRELVSSATSNNVENLEQCIFAHCAYEASHFSMNGHPMTPMEYLAYIDSAVSAFPEKPKDKKYEHDVAFFVEDLYRHLETRNKQLRLLRSPDYFAEHEKHEKQQSRAVLAAQLLASRYEMN